MAVSLREGGWVREGEGLDPTRWEGMVEHIDIVNLWRGHEDLNAALERCSGVLPEKPTYIGRYPTRDKCPFRGR